MTTTTNDTDYPVLQLALQQFCSRYRYLFPDRIHNAIYLLDHNHAEKHGEPYTEASYQPGWSGVYSPDIKHVLANEIDTRTKPIRLTSSPR